MFKTLPKTKYRMFFKVVIRFVGYLLLFCVLAYAGLAFYLDRYKEDVLNKVTGMLNENISGQLTIGSMETTLLQDFPGISVSLQNVVLRDSLYNTHKHTFLRAANIGVSVNTLALLRGKVQISKVTLTNAAVDIFTQKNGYANTAVFKVKRQGENTGALQNSFPELKYLWFKNILFTAENQRNHKQYKFEAYALKAAVGFNERVINAAVQLSGYAHTMAFNTQHGSFIENKTLKGNFDIVYNQDTKIMRFAPRALTIGGDTFTIGATLGLNEQGRFNIAIKNNAVLWKHAANLLSPNITKKLLLFNFNKPISVGCDLIGGFNDKGDPLIQVNARVVNNNLALPGGVIKRCGFFGVFTNERVKANGYSDENSAIKLFNFTGDFKGIPVVMNRFEIKNLDYPIAVGALTSTFNVKALYGFADTSLLRLNSGTAQARLKFRADVEHFRLVKPLVEGNVIIKRAAITYVPRKLGFKNISVNLHFNKDNLSIDKLMLTRGRSSFVMKGTVTNFLNLYYHAPEKLMLRWNVYSPKLYLEEFLAFLKNRNIAPVRAAAKGSLRNSNVVNAVGDLFENGTVDMTVRAGELHYKKFKATNAHAFISLTDNGTIAVKNAGFNHAGGNLFLKGTVQPGKVTKYSLSSRVTNTDVSTFFYAFDNFGMKTLNYKNLKGKLFAQTDITGSITNGGVLLPRSINGNISFVLKSGELLNFEPLVRVGKFAFPFRDVKNVAFKDLAGKLDVMGEKVQVSPLKISSSVLNMDVQGVYSFGAGTLLYLDIPLRNPGKDKDVVDEKELEKRRNRGVVVHLVAEDGNDGKVKIRLGRKK